MARTLLAVLAVAWALRVCLVLRGGQMYWPDEVRYLRSWHLWSDLAAGRFGPALDLVLNSPDHVGFLVGGLPVAAFHVGSLRLAGLAMDPSTVAATAWLPAAVLSLASVASIGLTYALACRAGARSSEALAAATLMACSNTQLYYARHLLPYDLSMALALGALWLGLDPRRSAQQFLLSGLAGGAAFLVYNGHWALVAACMAVVVARGAPRGLPVRSLLASVGLAALPAVLTLIGKGRGHVSFLAQMAAFSRLAATQADLGEGWSLPRVYLWHAEHGLLLLWLAVAGTAFVFGDRGCDLARQRLRLWSGGWMAIYGLTVLFSTGLGWFGAFGRLAREVVPFASLATAAGAASLGERRRWASARPWLGAALAAQTVFNFAGPLRQRFPTEYARQAESAFGALPRELSVSGPVVSGRAPGPDDPCVLVNAQHLYPVLGPRPVSPGREIDGAPHPLEFRPYQYEGYTPPERAVLRSVDLSMRVVDRRRRARTRPDPAGGECAAPPR